MSRLEKLVLINTPGETVLERPLAAGVIRIFEKGKASVYFDFVRRTNN